MSDRERELEERNARLTTTLREARDQLREVADYAREGERLQAICGALDYAILAVDMRVAECKAAVARGVVGQDADRAQALSNFAIERIFETALRAAGYEVVQVVEAVAR